MFTWFATTLRQYPEIAIFLVLALGYYFGKFTFKGIGLGSVTATLIAGVRDRANRNHDLCAPEGHSISHVSVCGGLRGGAAVCSRRSQGRIATSHVCGGAVCVLPAGSVCHCKGGGLRSGLFRGTLLGVPDNLGCHGPFDRRDQPRGHGAGANQGHARTRCRLRMP